MIPSHPQHQRRLTERLKVFMDAKEDFCQKDERWMYFRAQKDQAYEERDASYRKLDNAHRELVELMNAQTTGDDGLPVAAVQVPK